MVASFVYFLRINIGIGTCINFKLYSRTHVQVDLSFEVQIKLYSDICEKKLFTSIYTM